MTHSINPTTGFIIPRALAGWGLTLALALLPAASLRADASATAGTIRYTGKDFEGRQSFLLEWTALSNATYLVQAATDLAAPDSWHTVDVVTPTNGAGQYEIKGRSIPENSVEFYRLLLPQPEISSVEPAVVAPGVPVDAYVIGQCFGTNTVLTINGVIQSDAVVQGTTIILKPSFVPDLPGAYQFSLVVGGAVVSSFNVTCADALANPELVLQGPPTEPPASPSKKDFKGHVTLLKAFDDDSDSSARHTKTGHVTLMKAFDDGGEAIQEGKKGLNAVNVKLARCSGEVQQQIVDLAVEGRGLDFVWARTYHSRNGHTGAAANGWTFSYDLHLQPLGGGILIHDGTGRADTFKPDKSGVYTCPEFFREGTLSNDIFRLTFADSGYWEFNPLDASAAAGKLARIVDRNGNTLSLNYDTSGRLASVVDDLDRTNTVSYNLAGQLEAVTDFSGRTVTYTYYAGEAGGSPGDLKSVTSPPVTGTPNGNNFPDGKTTTYTYSTGSTTEAENHLLLSVKDALGQTTVQCGYDTNSTSPSYLRCTSLQRGTGKIERITVLPQIASPVNHFAVVRCIVNDPEGNVTEYFYDARNRLVKLQEFTGRATPEVPVTDTLNRPTGKLRADDPPYYETQWAWDNDSLCTRLVMDSHQIQCIYESDFDPATRPRKRADLRVVRELAAGGVDLDGDGVADATERTWRYEYDPRFGSSGDRYLLGLKTYDPTKQYLVGDTTICNGGIWQKVDNSDSPINNTRTRVNELESRLQGLGLLGRAANGGINEKLPYATLHASRGKKLYVGNLPFAADEGIIADTRQRVRDLENILKNLGLLSRTTGGGRRFGIGNTTPAGPLGKKGWDGTIKGSGAKIVTDRDTGRSKGFGFVTAATDPRGNVTTVNYDAKGNPAQVRISVSSCGANAPVINCAYDNHGQLTAVTNLPDANCSRRVDTFTWSQGQLTQCVVDAGAGGLALTTGFEYDDYGNITRQVDPRGNDWLFTYNSLDQCVRAQSPVNLSARCATDYYYDANDNLVQCATELRDATDRLAGSQANHASYDPLHRLTELALAVDADHALTNRFVYDDNDQCVQVLGGDAVSGADPHQTVAYEYDERGLLFRAIDAPGSPLAGTNEFSYTATYNPATKKYVDAGDSLRISSFAYDGFDRLASATDPMGNQTTFNYDANGNLKVLRHFGETNDVPWSTGNLRLAESRCDYDGLDRLVKVHALHFGLRTQLPVGDGECTTTFGYAPNGDCGRVTDDLGHTTTFAYDTAGRVYSVTVPGGQSIRSCVRDPAGNVTAAIQTDTPGLGGPPQVFAWTNVYDALNRSVSSTDSAGNTSTCAYDSLDRVAAQFNPREYKRTFSYDLLGRCTLAVGDLDGDGVPDFTKDITEQATWSSSSGRLLSTTDSHGNTTSYAYDSLGNCTTVTQADGTHQQLVWSPRSNLVREEDANGNVITNSYDLNDRIIHRDLAARFEAFAYDGGGRLTGETDDDCNGNFTYDSLGNCVAETLNGLATTSTYDGLGNRLSLTYPGGRALAYAYDANGCCTSITESGATLASFDYDGVSRISRVTYGNGTSTHIAYDGLAGTPNATGDHGFGQIRRIRHELAADSAVIDDRTFGYDPAQNKTTRDLAAPFTLGGAAQARSFQYDAADRLVASLVTTNGAMASLVAYGLDRMGNRTNATGAACSGDYTMDAASPPADFQMNQYTATPCDNRAYDDNGNLTSRVSAAGPVTYEYDYADRLVRVVGLDSGSGSLSPLASYTYDALGRRVSKTLYSGGVPTGTNLFLYDGGSVIEERDNSAVAATYVVDDRYLLGLRRGGQDYFVHTDDQGNTLALTGTGGAVVERYDYDDYGAVTFLTSDGFPTSAATSAYGNVYCWGGLRLDAETGLQNNDGSEYLEPQTGRAVRGKVKVVRDMGTSAASATASRARLKGYFESGDKPTAAQFGTLIDSTVNRITDRYLLGLRVSGLGGNNPWTGGPPDAMKKGTVKFFNETKGFGIMAEETVVFRPHRGEVK